jgi:hypothetical protein
MAAKKRIRPMPPGFRLFSERPFRYFSPTALPEASSGGRCYDRNFRRFLPIFRRTNWRFSKKNPMLRSHFFAKTNSSLRKNAIFWQFFLIVTSVQGAYPTKSWFTIGLQIFVTVLIFYQYFLARQVCVLLCV